MDTKSRFTIRGKTVTNASLHQSIAVLPPLMEIVPLLTGVITGVCSVLTESVERQRVLGKDDQSDFGYGAKQTSA